MKGKNPHKTLKSNVIYADLSIVMSNLTLIADFDLDKFYHQNSGKFAAKCD